MTRNGLGFSYGIPGLRVGVSPSGRKWISLGFPELGLYFFRYLGNQTTCNHRERKHIVSEDDEVFEVNEQRQQLHLLKIGKRISYKYVKFDAFSVTIKLISLFN